MERLTRFWMPVGKKTIVIGGALQGCQLAEFLVKRGRQVTIVDTSPKIGEGLLFEDTERLFKWFKRKGVVIIPQVKYNEITKKGLVITTLEGKHQLLEADNIITALPLLPNPALLESLKDKVPEIYQIGDCKAPAYIPDAVLDGSRLARLI
jgi:pyruvate/2-oxoglutarate dehydrogenase complex dihydrolipoamide dehydrogenase (E3) component